VDFNPYIVVPFATWAIAQIAKFALHALRGRVDLRYLYASGGMPSVHSAVVCSLAVTAFLVSGASSPFFGFAAIFAGIVMYDSFGVRRSAGEQAEAINMLIESLDRSRVKLAEPDLQLREILGHQPREVTVGALLGIVLAAFFNYNRLGPAGKFVEATPQHFELMVYAAVFGVIVVGGLVARLVLGMRYPKSKTMRKFGRRLMAMTQTVGWLGLASVLLVYENASYLSWRLWPVVVVGVGVVWGGWLLAASYRTVPQGLSKEQQAARKLKWLQWGRGKNRRKAT
jgi:uncharacterized protein